MLLFKFTSHDFNVLKKSLEVTKVETDIFFHIVPYIWVIIKKKKVRDWDLVVSLVAD